MSLSSLDSFVPGAQAQKPEKSKPSQSYSLPSGVPEALVLTFDQTLGHTGWALLHVVHLSECGVRTLDVGDIKLDAPDGMKGFEANSWLTRHLAHAVADVLAKATVAVRNRVAPLYVVREMSAVRGYRPESSITAAAVVDTVCALAGHESIAIVNNQHMKVALTGTKEASKAGVKKAVLDRLPEARDMRPMNTNVTDALALGLTWLLDNP